MNVEKEGCSAVVERKPHVAENRGLNPVITKGFLSFVFLLFSFIIRVSSIRSSVSCISTCDVKSYQSCYLVGGLHNKEEAMTLLNQQPQV